MINGDVIQRKKRNTETSPGLLATAKVLAPSEVHELLRRDEARNAPSPQVFELRIIDGEVS